VEKENLAANDDGGFTFYKQVKRQDELKLSIQSDIAGACLVA
jgi:hypothetical protein